MKTISRIILAISIFILDGLQAQNNISFFHLEDYVQQTTDVSPVYVPKNSLSLGILPGINGVYASISSDLPANLILTPDTNNSNANDLNFQSIIDNLKGNHLNLDVQQSINILQLSFKKEKGSFTFFANQKLNTNFSFSKNGIFNIANGGLRLNNNQILFDDEINGTAFIEIGAGITRQFLNQKLAIGLKAKYIIGLANISTFDDGSLIIDIEDDYSWVINSKNAGIRSSSIIDDTDNLFSLNNTGIGFDIGASYKILPNLEVELAINDIGSITWKNNVNEYLLDNVTDIVIDGVDLTNDGDLEEEFFDKIEEATNGRERNGGTYKTSLPTNSYLSVSYKLGFIHQFRATMFNRHTFTDNKPVLAAGYNLALKRTTYGVVGIKDEVGNANLGINLATKLGPLQLYFASDNLVSTLSNLNTPEKITKVNARVGINFVFGYKKWIEKNYRWDKKNRWIKKKK